jgi:hypothetical protein
MQKKLYPRVSYHYRLLCQLPSSDLIHWNGMNLNKKELLVLGFMQFDNGTNVRHVSDLVCVDKVYQALY